MLISQTMLTANATGDVLNRAVAECEGLKTFPYVLKDGWKRFEPNQDRHMAEPIIERAGISFAYDEAAPEGHRHIAIRRHGPRGRTVARGPDLLIAAMRCRVASEIGDTIILPHTAPVFC